MSIGKFPFALVSLSFDKTAASTFAVANIVSLALEWYVAVIEVTINRSFGFRALITDNPPAVSPNSTNAAAWIELNGFLIPLFSCTSNKHSPFSYKATLNGMLLLYGFMNLTI
eukprot:NODE_117_length_18986_cov_0.639540.p14 type:complete len:113 gc:universal NODE_117_length_18986_cov_0.639540:18464-18126(-)